MIEWNWRFVKDRPSGSEDIPTVPDALVRPSLPHRRQRRRDLLERLALGVDGVQPGDDCGGEHEKSGENIAAKDACRDPLSISLPKTSGAATPPTPVPMA